MAATKDKPRTAARVFDPGQTAAGCTVILSRVEAAFPYSAVRLACACGCAFAATAANVDAAERVGAALKCVGCMPPPPPLPVVGGRPLTPAELTDRDWVVLAAADLTTAGNRDFTEFDLTVAAWSLNRAVFGLRGFEQSYPNHKRVSLSLVSSRVGTPVYFKFVERVTPTVYRLTPAGAKEAARLRAALEAGRP